MIRTLYLAGSVSRLAELQAVASTLREKGYEITSRWLDEIVPNVGFDKYPDDLKARRAVRDIEDIQRADVLLHFASGYGALVRGGGRHWEGGYAWAFGKPVIVIGPADHLFHSLPGVYLEDDFDGALSTLDWLDVYLFNNDQSADNLATIYDKEGTN